MIHEHRHFIEWVVWAGTLIGAFSINQILGAIAFVVSIIIGVYRIHDRIVYGPVQRGRDE